MVETMKKYSLEFFRQCGRKSAGNRKPKSLTSIRAKQMGKASGLARAKNKPQPKIADWILKSGGKLK